MRMEHTVISGLSCYKILFYIKSQAEKFSEKFIEFSKIEGKNTKFDALCLSCIFWKIDLNTQIIL